MIALELIQTVQDFISEETYNRFNKAEILRWLNRGLEDIAIKTGYLTWKWKLETVATHPEYPYPDEAQSLYRFEYNDEPLPPCDRPELDAEAAEDGTKWLTATGPPEHWYHAWNRAFGIHPCPDAKYIIYMFGLSREAILTDDAQVPLMPEQFHLAPARFAAREILRIDKELTTSASMNKSYQEMLGDMITERDKMTKKGRNYRVGYSRTTVSEGG